MLAAWGAKLIPGGPLMDKSRAMLGIASIPNRNVPLARFCVKKNLVFTRFPRKAMRKT